jgi:hypothetical protein
MKCKLVNIDREITRVEFPRRALRLRQRPRRMIDPAGNADRLVVNQGDVLASMRNERVRLSRVGELERSR